MAADELRQRVQAEIDRHPNLTANAVAERAHIVPTTLHKWLTHPARGIDPDTCRKLAGFFEWPEVDVFRWAGLLSPSTGDPAEDAHRLASPPGAR